MIRYLILTLFCLSSTLPISAQDVDMGDTLRVNALSGLHLRQQATTQSLSKKLLPYGHPVVVVSESKGKPVLLDGLTGNWVRASAGRDTGYVFNAYLTRLPVFMNKPVKDQNLGASLEEYAFEKLGVLDSVYYTNGADGEPFHRMTIFNLRGGHQYIRHGFWENEEWELQLLNVRDSEGIQLILNLLKLWGRSTPDIENTLKKMHSTGSTLINDAEVCYRIHVFKAGNRIIIRISSCGS